LITGGFEIREIRVGVTPRVSESDDGEVFILHKSTVKATLNNPCELLGIIRRQERKPRVLDKSWEGINSRVEAVKNSLVVVS